MTNNEVIEYITPFIKSMKIKKVNDMEAKVLVYNNVLICTDSEEAGLYVVNLIDTNTIIAGFLDDIVVNPNQVNYNVYQRLIQHYYNYTNISSWNIERVNMELDENFMAMCLSRATDGLFQYKLDENIMLPLFYGLVPVAKADKVSVYVNNTPNYIFVKYIIYKKKLKTNIYLYVKLLNLSRG